MDALYLLDAITNIDESFILEAKTYKCKKLLKRKFMAIAACLLLCVGAVASSVVYIENSRNIQTKENAEQSETEFSNNNSDITEASASEIMQNLDLYFLSNEVPEWFGDYYCEGDTVYVLLVNNTEKNRQKTEEWAKSADIVFKKARYSYNYLNKIIENISADITSGKIDYIRSVTLDSKNNNIIIETNRKITDNETAAISEYDELSEGGVFKIFQMSEKGKEVTDKD